MFGIAPDEFREARNNDGKDNPYWNFDGEDIVEELVAVLVDNDWTLCPDNDCGNCCVWAADSDISGEYGTNVEIDGSEAYVWFIAADRSGYQKYLYK